MKAAVLAILMLAACQADAESLRLSGSTSKSRAEQFARQTTLMEKRIADRNAYCTANPEICAEQDRKYRQTTPRCVTTTWSSWSEFGDMGGAATTCW